MGFTGQASTSFSERTMVELTRLPLMLVASSEISSFQMPVKSVEYNQFFFHAGDEKQLLYPLISLTAKEMLPFFFSFFSPDPSTKP